MVLQRCGRVGSRQALFLPFVGLRALRFVRSCEAVHAALSPLRLLALHRSMLRMELHPSCILVIPWSILPSPFAMHPWPFRSICGVRSGCSIRSVRHVRPIRCIRRACPLSAFPQKTKMRTSRWWMELPFDAIPLISILYLHLLNLFSSFG